jgi:hypothetical protein
MPSSPPSEAGPATGEGLAIVTVCMNRLEHLLGSAAEVARWPFHQQHLIVDWSSSVPLRRAQLPDDPRIRLLRVEGEAGWNLCRAYNFAITHTGLPWILKLDADTWPTAAFDPGALELGGPARCAFGTGQLGRKGQFLMARELFLAVGGFHELLSGYGFDDKDLQARLGLHTGHPPLAIPSAWIGVIEHGDAVRAGRPGGRGSSELASCWALAAMRSSRLGNRLLAAHCPWSRRASASRYRELAPQVWRLEAGSLPEAPEELADEVGHARRLAFWGCFLAIPDVFLAELPIKLVPPAVAGQWPVRWWHRLWWHSGRRLLRLPIWLLSLSRGRLGALTARRDRLGSAG